MWRVWPLGKTLCQNIKASNYPVKGPKQCEKHIISPPRNNNISILAYFYGKLSEE